MYLYDPPFVDLLGYLGFDVLWIEMEHGPISLAEGGDLCRIAAGAGLLTMIRIPDARRESVLKAAELGPDILDLPMANTPETVAEFVQHARYPPQGNRGFFSISRAVRYGACASIREEQQRVNSTLSLMIQIETREAVERVGDLCSVPGIDAVFLGPGDLSASFGVPGDVGNPLVRDAMRNTIRVARDCGKLLCATCAPAEATFWAAEGINLLFCASSIACQRLGAQTILREAAAAARQRPTRA
jgi:2-keto-3-deoxy-L-rhamnonate aldolase RhmA